MGAERAHRARRRAADEYFRRAAVRGARRRMEFDPGDRAPAARHGGRTADRECEALAVGDCLGRFSGFPQMKPLPRRTPDNEPIEWRPASGRGRISTWTVVHKAWFPAFAADIPYNVVQVELDEGPRLTANVVGLPNERLAIGLPVTIDFDDVTAELTMPRFRPRNE